MTSSTSAQKLSWATRVVAQTGRDSQERTDEQVTEIRRGGSIGHAGKVPLEHGSSSWCVEHLTEGDQWREQESPP